MYDKSIFNYGITSVVSFHGTKVFTTMEGGAVICPTLEIKDKNYSNKSEIQKLLNQKLGKNPTRSISDEGMIDIHSYAFGGYLEILKNFNNKLPNDLLAFFSVINNLIKDQ